jgi:hypothetical protein
MWVGALLAAADRTGAGLAVTVWVALVTVRVLTVFAAGAGDVSLVGAVALASGAAGVPSVTGGGDELGAGCVVAVVGSEVTGCVVCAARGVEESARAATIAGSAPADAWCAVLIIIRINRALERRSHDYRSAEA